MKNNLKVKITTPSLILFIKLLKAMGVSIPVIAEKLQELSGTMQKVNDVDDELNIESVELENRQEQLGMFLVELLFDGVDKAEDLTYKFLSKIFFMSEEEVQELDFFMEVLPAIKTYEGWGNFLDNAFNLETSKK